MRRFTAGFALGVITGAVAAVALVTWRWAAMLEEWKP